MNVHRRLVKLCTATDSDISDYVLIKRQNDRACRICKFIHSMSMKNLWTSIISGKSFEEQLERS